MAKESLRSQVSRDVKAVEKAIASEEKTIVTRIRTKAHRQTRESAKVEIDEHIQEEM